MVGDRCTRTSECPVGLTCGYGRCRDECVTFRDCPLGSTCLFDATTSTHVCRVPDEVGCTTDEGCAAGLSCVEGRCAQRCTTTAECSDLVCVGGETTRTCAEPTGAECAGDADCAWGVCDEGRCDEVRRIAAGGPFTCVLLESGAIECAGENVDWAIVPDDTRPILTTFARVADSSGGAPPFDRLGLGANHLCALEGGEVRCWGGGNFGQTAGPSGRTAPFPEPVVALTGVLDLAVGLDLSCVRTATEVICWGTDRYGLLGDTEEYPSTPTTDPMRSRPEPIELTGPTRDLDAGFYHACAVTLDGDVWCWGANDHGNLGVAPTGETCTATVIPGTPIACSTTPVRATEVGTAAGLPVTDVTVGAQHTCALGHEGAVYCWGANAEGQLGSGVLGGADAIEPVRVLDGAIDVEAGTHHTCALLSDGRVACWGRDSGAQLGDGGGGARSSPVYASGIDDAVALAVADQHACVLLSTGEVMCWGADGRGQLGDGSMEPDPRDPTPIPTLVRSGP